MDKTGIAVKGFKDKFYKISYKAKDKAFERHVYVASEHAGVPTFKGDMDKYGIEIYSPTLLFTNKWRVKSMYKLAPGIGQTIIRYYKDLPDFSERFPTFIPLNAGNIEDICREV